MCASEQRNKFFRKIWVTLSRIKVLHCFSTDTVFNIRCTVSWHKSPIFALPGIFLPKGPAIVGHKWHKLLHYLVLLSFTDTSRLNFFCQFSVDHISFDLLLHLLDPACLLACLARYIGALFSIPLTLRRFLLFLLIFKTFCPSVCRILGSSCDITSCSTVISCFLRRVI